MNELVKKISIKVVLLFMVVLGLNQVYKHTFYEADLERFSGDYRQMILEAEKSDIIFMGDCSDAYRVSGDSLNGIGENLARFSDKNVATISSNGFHPGSYLAFARILDLENKTVIITMNLRAFSPKISNDYVYSPVIERKLKLLNKSKPPLFNRMRLVYDQPDQKLQEKTEEKITRAWEEMDLSDVSKFKNIKEWYDSYNEGSEIKLGPEDIAHSYIHDFAFLLDSTHEHIENFDLLLKESEKDSSTLYFHIPPINFKDAIDFVDEDLVRIIKSNLDFLKSRYNNIIDNSGLEVKFIGEYASSHYPSEVRLDLAKAISEKIDK